MGIKTDVTEVSAKLDCYYRLLNDSSINKVLNMLGAFKKVNENRFKEMTSRSECYCEMLDNRFKSKIFETALDEMIDESFSTLGAFKEEKDEKQKKKGKLWW